MKRFNLMLLSIVALISCTGKKAETTATDDVNTLRAQVFETLNSTDASILDIKDKVLILLDSLQWQVNNSPDDKVLLLEAKTTASLLGAYCIQEEATPEEKNFFLDSMATPFSNIINTWGRTTIAMDGEEYPMLIQFIPRIDDDGKILITVLVVICTSKLNMVVVHFPEDAVANPSIMFSDNINDIDTISFHHDDTIDFKERTDEIVMTAIFDQRLIDAMLVHNRMFIGYINDNAEIMNETERFSDCVLSLEKFHEQYNQLMTELTQATAE